MFDSRELEIEVLLFVQPPWIQKWSPCPTWHRTCYTCRIRHTRNSKSRTSIDRTMFRFVLAACSVSLILVLVYALIFVGQRLLLLSICVLVGEVSTAYIVGMWLTEDSDMLSADSSGCENLDSRRGAPVNPPHSSPVPTKGSFALVYQRHRLHSLLSCQPPKKLRDSLQMQGSLKLLCGCSDIYIPSMLRRSL